MTGGQTPAQKALPWSWQSYGQSFLHSREVSCRPSPPPISEAERALLFSLEKPPPPQLSLQSPASLGVGCGRGLTCSARDALKRSQTQREVPGYWGAELSSHTLGSDVSKEVGLLSQDSEMV